MPDLFLFLLALVLGFTWGVLFEQTRTIRAQTRALEKRLDDLMLATADKQADKRIREDLFGKEEVREDEWDEDKVWSPQPLPYVSAPPNTIPYVPYTSPSTGDYYGDNTITYTDGSEKILPLTAVESDWNTTLIADNTALKTPSSPSFREAEQLIKSLLEEKTTWKKS